MLSLLIQMREFVSSFQRGRERPIQHLFFGRRHSSKCATSVSADNVNNDGDNRESFHGGKQSHHQSAAKSLSRDWLHISTSHCVFNLSFKLTLLQYMYLAEYGAHAQPSVHSPIVQHKPIHRHHCQRPTVKCVHISFTLRGDGEIRRERFSTFGLTYSTKLF